MNFKQAMKKVAALFGLAATIIGIYCAGFVPGGKHNPLLSGGRVLFLGDSITQNGEYVSFIEYYLVKAYPDRPFDIISIGLSSETVSGLTEKNHAYPRPCLHERLQRALDKVKPGLVIACYGMNDGIYHPPSADRMKAFQDGILKLIREVRAAGAEVILLTPPPFDPLPVASKLVKDNAEEYGYSKTYYRYDGVLEGYGRWIMDLQLQGVRTMDLNTPMMQYVKQKRLEDHSFCFSPDGVHPSPAGHLFMALEFLDGLGISNEIKDLDKEWSRVTSDSLFSLVDRHRKIRSAGWLDYVGYTREKTVRNKSVLETEREAARIWQKIDQMRRQTVGIRGPKKQMPAFEKRFSLDRTAGERLQVDRKGAVSDPPDGFCSSGILPNPRRKGLPSSIPWSECSST